MAEASHARTAWVDALRGVAVVWMVVYHFCYDLNWYGWAKWQMLSDPLWTLQRAAIVSLFMFCAGLSQVLAWRSGQSAAAFWRRWRQIALAALLVSAATALVFPTTWIYFGVLHAMAVMWLLTRALARWVHSPAAWAVCGALVWASAWGVPWLLAQLGGDALQRVLDGLPGNVLGWVAHQPLTQDYAPLAPWWGLMLLGVACARWRWRGAESSAAKAARELGAALGALVWLGRHSLSVYLVHQPLLLAGFELLRQFGV